MPFSEKSILQYFLKSIIRENLSNLSAKNLKSSKIFVLAKIILANTFPIKVQ